MYEGTMRLVLDFKGDLENYRRRVGPMTEQGGAACFQMISAMKSGYDWSDLLRTEFRFSVSELRSDEIEARVESALRAYNDAAAEAVLNIEAYEDPHTCVQWVFRDGRWVAIYNYNLWLSDEDPKETLRRLGIETRRALSVRYRAVVEFSLS